MDAFDGDSTTRNEELISGAETLAQNILDDNPDNRVGVVDFDSGANVLLSVDNSDSQDYSAVETQINNIDTSGGTDIGNGISAADDDLANCPEGTQTVQIVVTDGQGGDPTTAADNAVGDSGNTDEIFAVGTGGANEASLLEFARPQNDEHTFLTQSGESLDDLLAQLGEEVLAGEQVFATLSLRELLLELSEGNGIPLDGDTSQGSFNELADSSDADTRQCFPGNATQCIGFSWWLPVDHANEIQSDSVGFDLGFYTEQCRHNDGAGMNNEAVNDDEVNA